jgi:EmrB/QacA subfamily drug resistance transporter
MTKRQVMTTFMGVVLGVLLAAIDQTIVATALPRIVSDLHGFNHLSWVVTAYLLASTVTMPIYGKLSDLHGRKPLYLIAIVIFLVGSALCGAAQDMNQLIAFRAVQGIGAGGLIPLAMAIMGDLFSPRDRGRYVGFVGATWALAAIAGPLLGGTLTDNVSWRWIFYINIPVGLVALTVIATTMHVPFQRREHTIDYLGAALLAVAVSSFLLATVWGGVTYPWGSWQVLTALAIAIVCTGLFIVVEQRAAEPVLPLSLFRNSVFRVSTIAAVLVGAAIFSTLVYIPVFVQGVIGASATSSGVVLIPLMLGWVLASIASGQIISRTGRYKIFPIAGTIIVLVGFWLLTRLSVNSTNGIAIFDMVVVGLGMGLLAQTYVLAVQNAVEPTELGTATAANQFFRQIGAMFAVAGLGTLLISRLKTELNQQLGAEAHRVDPSRLLHAPDKAQHLPPELVAGTHAALAAALHDVFLVGIPIVVCALVLAFMLKELPLRTTPGAAAAQETAPASAEDQPTGVPARSIAAR